MVFEPLEAEVESPRLEPFDRFAYDRSNRVMLGRVSVGERGQEDCGQTWARIDVHAPAIVPSV